MTSAHVLGRTAIVAALLTIPPATDSGLGADTARTMSRAAGIAALAVGTSLAAGVVGWWVAPLLGAVAVGVAVTGWLAIRKIGGLAGDVLGAIEQVVECLVLVVAAGLAARYDVWWS